ncbi:MAG: Hpt domain-containing protein [Verrucomicrobiia bacterium]|jgi:HPt (histidine-containing phosphotransfer) domain-containing protein
METPDRLGQEKPAVDAAAIERLREIGDGDVAFLKDVFSAFESDTAQRLVAMRETLAAGDFTGLKRAAHTIKGSSLNVGASNLTAVSLQLEQLAGSGKLEGAAELICRIEEEFKRVAVELHNITQG